jgi:molybdate transport system ATP-binding protein
LETDHKLAILIKSINNSAFTFYFLFKIGMEIIINEVRIMLGGNLLLDNITITMGHDEQWAITGPSGSGKSTLARAIAGKIFHRGIIRFVTLEELIEQPKILLIEQQHQFTNRSNVQQFYYQQRFNSSDAEDSLTVAEQFDDTDQKLNEYWINFFNITPIIDKPLIQLSNGENKRLQLAKAMTQSPSLLILDNPFVGLDKAGRSTLKEGLNKIVQAGTKIILFADPEDFPASITHVAMIKEGKIIFAGPKNNQPQKDELLETDALVLSPFALKKHYATSSLVFNHAVEMSNVNIAYNGKKILENFNWEVKKGERWCVTGPNGAGKSTLLSLISADNPQAYANEIFLFDRKRGTGESIWDIKKNIGYVSPELHLFFDLGITCQEAVASGLFDTIGLFRKPGTTETSTVLEWMDIIGISSIKEKRLNQLSLGEQRLVMLTRALVKSPPLLILDEPCQGLDSEQTARFKNTIDQICGSTSTTLIYVSHYTQDVPSCISHHLQLKAGKKVED